MKIKVNEKNYLKLLFLVKNEVQKYVNISIFLQ